MSESLRDSAVSQFQKTLSLMREGKLIEALKELEKAEKAAKLLLENPEHEFFQTNLQITTKKPLSSIELEKLGVERN